MTRTVRLVVFGLGGAALAVLFALALLRMPPFGTADHPYRDLAVAAAAAHQTGNAVSSVNFDVRGLDTLGEEIILLGSVVGAATLLRPARDESERREPRGGRVLDSTALLCWVLLAVTTLIGIDVVVHGHLTPGGGFQGGVVLATGLHLLYLAGSYPALRRLRPLSWYQWGEGVGAAGFAAIGVAGTVAGGAYLANVLPLGTLGHIASAGTVPLLSLAVGVAVTCGTVVLLAQFLTQELRITRRE
ncbi:MnhB domain-containing protein [Actinocatenispora rupis]|uniref:Na+/H+ antiporter MnhB subunit-related protein domain-containing protein n=1 Tax=Actinocatenispora rupis TaxID=519421 RepID=A0A8J3J6B4_9ACTN|nr:MnhB domain-containing protein [Actinocatenispora rupis]GID12421.1 hypothetical protein Aru02nite_33100 [Actinocatenispora rupis]